MPRVVRFLNHNFVFAILSILPQKAPKLFKTSEILGLDVVKLTHGQQADEQNHYSQSPDDCEVNCSEENAV
jgi:hypothetical protein